MIVLWVLLSAITKPLKEWALVQIQWNKKSQIKFLVMKSSMTKMNSKMILILNPKSPLLQKSHSTCWVMICLQSKSLNNKNLPEITLWIFIQIRSLSNKSSLNLLNRIFMLYFNNLNRDLRCNKWLKCNKWHKFNKWLICSKCNKCLNSLKFLKTSMDNNFSKLNNPNKYSIMLNQALDFPNNKLVIPWTILNSNKVLLEIISPNFKRKVHLSLKKILLVIFLTKIWILEMTKSLPQTLQETKVFFWLRYWRLILLIYMIMFLSFINI